MKKLFAFFIMLLSIGNTQAQGSFKNYENDKYRFSFSYPGEYLLEKINDEEWSITFADGTWGLGFKIMHLQGKSYDSYVNSLSTSLINTYFNELSAKFDAPEKNPYGKFLIHGFEFDLFISGYMPSGSGLENLTKSMNIYLNIFRKTSHASFIPDGIIIYTFGRGIDVDRNKMIKQFISTFEKTVVFKEAIVKKPVVTTVAKKKRVTTTPVVKKTVAPKPPTSIGSSKAPAKLTSVKIGKQTWMVKNLDVAKYRNGDPIPNVTDNTAWSKLTTGAYCYYKNDSATYAATYGKLYNWYAVNDPRGLAPAGWHVPSDAEWTPLNDYLGDVLVAGGKMKEIGTTHWETPNTGATNSSGFTGLPGGCRNSDGSFQEKGLEGNWWCSTKLDPDRAWFRFLRHYNEYSSRSCYNILFGFSVRCLRD